jgi:cell wall-associated NlpC family hydrolase
VHLTEGGRRIARSFGRGHRRRTLSIGVAALAAVGTLSGALVAVLSAAPTGQSASGGAGNALAASSVFGLPNVRPSTGSAPVAPGLAMGDAAKLLAVPVAASSAGSSAVEAKVAPLRKTVQADLLIVAPFSLSDSVTAKVSRIPGVVAAERIEAVRMPVNGTSTAVLGVDPSVFREFAARPTGASNALWQGVADGGIAVSYTMGTEDKIKLGGTVTAVGGTTKKLKVSAFGTLGIGGVNAVVSDATARALGAPAGNAIVVSVTPSDFTAAAAAAGRLIPKGAAVQQLVSLISTGGGTSESNGTGAAGAGQLSESSVPQATLNAMLKAAMSRRGLPYVWGGDGPTTFDCSGLVQWSFRQAGLVMPRVAADQALTGPSVPVSQLQPGDLLFYHTDPTDPTYISHVAIYIGNGWMEQAPEPGLDVEVVPADFGSEFAGAVRVNPAQAAAVAARVA